MRTGGRVVIHLRLGLGRLWFSCGIYVVGRSKVGEEGQRVSVVDGCRSSLQPLAPGITPLSVTRD
jgi:hypothetical protein